MERKDLEIKVTQAAKIVVASLHPMFSSQATRRSRLFLRPFVHGCFNRSQDQDREDRAEKSTPLVWYILTYLNLRSDG